MRDTHALEQQVLDVVVVERTEGVLRPPQGGGVLRRIVALVVGKEVGEELGAIAQLLGLNAHAVSIGRTQSSQIAPESSSSRICRRAC